MTPHVALSLVLLLVIAVLLLMVARRGRWERLSPLAGLAFAFVIAGIVFGDDRLIGYSLIAIGLALAIADIVRRTRQR
jgi:hypothetical protein